MKNKTKKIIYWVATIFLAFGMLSSGIVQLLRLDIEVEFMEHLGYPVYFLTILGIWKLLGVLAMLIPKYSLVKEWAYAGFFFTMSGAIYSHLALRDPISETIPAVVLLLLVVVSWYFRPDDRKIFVHK